MTITMPSDVKPIHARPRPLPSDKREFVRNHVDALEKFGLVFRNPSSDWAHPVNIVPKAGSAKYRLTVDLRQANALQRPSAYPMSHLESQLSRLHGSTCYQTYDLVQGYWKLPLSE